MNNARKGSEADRAKELQKLDLLPKREGEKRADDLLRAMLNSPPDPRTPAANARAKRRGKK
jgi:hypothetical protein